MALHRSVTALILACGLAGCAHDLPPAAGPTLAQAEPCAELGMAEEAGPGAPGYGCANLANLRAMIADPRDLETGVESTPARGDSAFAAAERHRTGRTKPLPGVDRGASTSEAATSGATTEGGND